MKNYSLMSIVVILLIVLLGIVSTSQAASVVFAGDNGGWAQKHGSISRVYDVAYSALSTCMENDSGCDAISTCDEGGWGAVVKSNLKIAASCGHSTRDGAIVGAARKIPYCVNYPENCSVRGTWYDPY
jgi:hypothetical protein